MQPVRGTHDLLPEESRKHRALGDRFLRIAGLYGFSEIETPIFEFSDVFKRTLGEASDIVSKEMYTFEDRSGDSLTLRPENTAGVVRAMISNGLAQHLPLKLAYWGAMFRHERPQKGRTRQFHQIGVELLGVANPQADLEVIALGHQLLREMKILELTSLQLNTIGDPTSRASYREALVEYFDKYKADLSADSQVRLQKNPLRILDSKDPRDQTAIQGAPEFHNYLNDESKKFFASVCEGLAQINIEFHLNPRLVRGLDYYTHTVFEFTTTHLGAQDAVLAGGRYDGLVEQMGGPSTPGIGWAAGVERLALLLPMQIEGPRPLAIIPLGELAEKHSVVLSQQLRVEGFAIELGYSGNLQKRMKRANKLNARHALILGDDELARGEITLKDLDSGHQRSVALADLVRQLKTEYGR